MMVVIEVQTMVQVVVVDSLLLVQTLMVAITQDPVVLV